MREQKTVWFAIVMSTFIYAVMIVWMAGLSPAGSFDDAVKKPFTLGCYGIALLMFVIGLFVVPNVVTTGAKAKMTVALAIFETCAIFALMAAIIEKDYRLYIPGWILALIGMIREWPSTSEAAEPRV